MRWVRLRWFGGDREDDPLRDIRYPIAAVSTFLDMANAGAIPGIPGPPVPGGYELIWNQNNDELTSNAAIVERHMHLIDLGIQNNDELLLVFLVEGPDPSFSAGCPNLERTRLSGPLLTHLV